MGCSNVRVYMGRLGMGVWVLAIGGEMNRRRVGFKGGGGEGLNREASGFRKGGKSGEEMKRRMVGFKGGGDGELNREASGFKGGGRKAGRQEEGGGGHFDSFQGDGWRRGVGV